MTRASRLIAAGTVAFVVMTAACSSNGSKSSAPGTHTTTPGTAAARPKLLATLPSIQLLTPGNGNGPRPVLRWAGAPGASTYDVVVYSAQGPAYWAWVGTGTSVRLGGETGPVPADAPGPKLAGGMTWQVFGYAADAKMLAASDRTSIGP